MISYFFSVQNKIIPKQLVYTIKMPQEHTADNWLTDQLFYLSPSKTARYSSGSVIPNQPPYQESCFLHIQDKIDRAFITLQANSTVKLPPVSLNAFPFPQITEDLFMAFASALFPLLFVLCMLLPVKNVIKVNKAVIFNLLG